MTTPTVAVNPAGGPARRVKVVTDSQVQGGPAIPVYGWTGLPTDGRPVEGAPAMLVKVITDADLQINGGRYWLEGRPFAMPVSDDASTPAVSEGNIAVAVYPVNAWPGSTPPPTPVLPQVASATLLLDLRASQLGLNNGDPISATTDGSGLGHIFTQSGAARPIYIANDGDGFPTMDFNTDKWMLGLDFADNLSSMAIFARVNLGISTSGILIGKINDSNVNSGWAVSGAGLLLTCQDEGDVNQTGVAIPQQPPVGYHTLALELVSLSEAHLYLDGSNASEIPNSSGVLTNYSTAQPVRIGKDGVNPVTNSFKMRALLLYAPAPNATDRAAIETWLTANP